MSLSSPLCSYTNQSLNLADLFLKMFYVSCHFSPFTQLAFSYRYHTFMSEIPDKSPTPISGCINSSDRYSGPSTIWTYSCEEGVQGPDEIFHWSHLCSYESFLAHFDKESLILTNLFKWRQYFQGQFNSHAYHYAFPENSRSKPFY